MKNIIILFLFAMLLSCEDDKWKDVHYTREELIKEWDIGECPVGVYFWDEFPEWKTHYNLNDEESMMLGEWTNIKQNDMGNYNCYFFPNKLFIISHYSWIYKNLNDKNVRIDKGIGTWEIQDNKVCAHMYYFLTERLRTEEKYLIPIKPYDIELIDIGHIDEIGYSKKPFAAFELPAELKNTFQIIPEEVREEGLRVRTLYWFNFMVRAENPPKYYPHFKTAPQMAKEGLSGLDIAQNPELIKKYIWGLWP